MSADQSDNLLEVRNLVTAFDTDVGQLTAVDGVSFNVQKGRTLGIVGESGCGKSVTALSIMRLLPQPMGKILGGEVIFDGNNLATLPAGDMRSIRGNRISMIFQEPMTALNPVLPIGHQVAETLLYHRKMNKEEANKTALELLDKVKIPSTSSRFKEYPHQFSGGMRQRVMIAMAIACKPDIILADEPTTALDVTTQSQILALLNELKQDSGMSLIFITHNLGVVASIADRVAVMYAGKIVEIADVNSLFAQPTHPYTEALMLSIPRSDRDIKTLHSISGQVPPIGRMPDGCSFATRCGLEQPICRKLDPTLQPIDVGLTHEVACWVRGDYNLTTIEERANG